MNLYQNGKIVIPDLENVTISIESQKQIIKDVNTIMNMFGYSLGVDDVYTVPETKSDFLENENNYETILKLLQFLNIIDMQLLSVLLMLALCKASLDKTIKRRFVQSGYWNKWIQTQNYIQESSECSFIGLEYTGNSCYQDSTLLALFAIPNDFIDDHILNANVYSISENPIRSIVCNEDIKEDYKRRLVIQKELQNITNSMRGKIQGTTCSNLRNLIKKCKSSSGQKFYSDTMQDAGEFIQYLFSLFDVEDTIQVRKTFVTNNLELYDINDLIPLRLVEEKTSPIILIPSHSIKQYKKTEIVDYLVQEQDSILDSKNLYKESSGMTYQRRIEKTTIIKAEYLIFYANRVFWSVDGKKKRTYNRIIANTEIKIDNKLLYLYAIVVHKDKHYTCYIKCRNVWFYYDDTKERIKLIGSYQDMKLYKPSIEKEGVLYFYSKN